MYCLDEYWLSSSHWGIKPATFLLRGMQSAFTAQTVSVQ